MKLYHHPLSSYSQKALIALYEKEIAFTPEVINMMDPAVRAEYAKVSPMGKMPLLVLDDGRKIFEASIIVEHLDVHHPTSGTRLIPEDRAAALEARFLDRVFDLYINDNIVKLFFDNMAPEAERDPRGVAAAKAALDKAYAMLDEVLAGRTWAIGDTFTIADCAAAPPLFYAHMAYPFEHKNLVAYTRRLAERPSYARVTREAAPYMAMFQGGR